MPIAGNQLRPRLVWHATSVDLHFFEDLVDSRFSRSTIGQRGNFAFGARR
jgi:hypothetical protein